MFKTSRINKQYLNKKRINKSSIENDTNSTPIIIDSNKGLKSYITIKKISNQLVIKDITTKAVIISKCKNISIINCKIFYLKCVACRNIIVQNNEIVDGALRYSRECIFQNNVFDHDFAKFSLSDRGSEIGDNTLKYLQRIFILPILIVGSLSILGFSLLNFIMGFCCFFSIIIPLAIIVDIRIKKKYIKGLDPNIFKNNKSGNIKTHLIQDLNKN